MMEMPNTRIQPIYEHQQDMLTNKSDLSNSRIYEHWNTDGGLDQRGKEEVSSWGNDRKSTNSLSS